MKNFQSLLQTDGNFLKLTLDNPTFLPEFSFEVVHQSKGRKTTVSVKDTGIISFEPQLNTSTKNIVLSSAIHGNETAPIEICAELVQAILLGNLTLEHRLLVIFGNPPAMLIGERFVEENLNRLFSGAHAKGEPNKEKQRAHQLEQVVSVFFLEGQKRNPDHSCLHYDLHTAIRGAKYDKFAVYPFLHGKTRSTEQLQFLGACGVNTLLLSGSPTTTFSYFSSSTFGAHAFTVELGKVKPFGENNMADFADVKQTLFSLVSQPTLSLKVYDVADFNLFKIYKTINRTVENFTLNFPDDTLNFTDFPLGYVLAVDGDKEYCVDKQGESIIFPNADVAIGQRALLTVTKVSEL